MAHAGLRKREAPLGGERSRPWGEKREPYA